MMAVGDTDLSICSDALISLGASPLSSFTEGTDAAQACDRLYPDLKNTLLSTYVWSWTLAKIQLARLSATPINEWKYAYQMPGDHLTGALAVFETDGTDQRSVRYGWEIYGNELVTNMETVFIDYQQTISEAKMPNYFVRLLRTALAAELAIVITDQSAKADYFRALAYGSAAENGRGGLIREAMNIDARGQSTQIIEDYSLIQVRQ
tara:strand:+ start:2377 stop:2997 length:621 start_codon:yes stop_codon:yes gene_type:complete